MRLPSSRRYLRLKTLIQHVRDTAPRAGGCNHRPVAWRTGFFRGHVSDLGDSVPVTTFSLSGGTYTGRVADERPAALHVLAPGYWPLFDRARGVFAADDRVRALWLSGSLARGVA